jgi:hypothetical protein
MKEKSWKLTDGNETGKTRCTQDPPERLQGLSLTVLFLSVAPSPIALLGLGVSISPSVRPSGPGSFWKSRLIIAGFSENLHAISSLSSHLRALKVLNCFTTPGIPVPRCSSSHGPYHYVFLLIVSSKSPVRLTIPQGMVG